MDAKVRTRPTSSDYARVFAEECDRAYPAITQFETECGFAIQKGRLESAARTLACPVKVNPPN